MYQASAELQGFVQIQKLSALMRWARNFNAVNQRRSARFQIT